MYNIVVMHFKNMFEMSVVSTSSLTHIPAASRLYTALISLDFPARNIWPLFFLLPRDYNVSSQALPRHVYTDSTQPPPSMPWRDSSCLHLSLCCHCSKHKQSVRRQCRQHRGGACFRARHSHGLSRGHHQLPLLPHQPLCCSVYLREAMSTSQWWRRADSYLLRFHPSHEWRECKFMDVAWIGWF